MLQGSEVAQLPALGITGQVGQCAAGGLVSQHLEPQRLCLGGLERHEIFPRQCGRRCSHIETEGHVFGDLADGLGERDRVVDAELDESLERRELGLEGAIGDPLGAGLGQHGAQLNAVQSEDRRKAGVGLRSEIQAGRAARLQVERVARRQHVARGVDLGVEACPGGIRVVGSIRAATHIAAEGDVRKAEHPGVVSHLGDAKLEVHIRRIDVGAVFERDVVKAGRAWFQGSRASEAQGHVDRQGTLDKVAIWNDRDCTVRIDDLHVVQAVRRIAQVEDGHDGRCVDHLYPIGLDLADAWPDQLGHGACLELRAADRHRDPAAVTALIGRHVADLERQGLDLDLGGEGAGARGQGAHHHVVVAGLAGWHHGLLVWLQRCVEAGVEVRGGGHLVPAHVNLVGRVGAVGVEAEAQRLARGHCDLVELPLADREVGVA